MGVKTLILTEMKILPVYFRFNAIDLLEGLPGQLFLIHQSNSAVGHLAPVLVWGIIKVHAVVFAVDNINAKIFVLTLRWAFIGAASKQGKTDNKRE